MSDHAITTEVTELPEADELAIVGDVDLGPFGAMLGPLGPMVTEMLNAAADAPDTADLAEQIDELSASVAQVNAKLDHLCNGLAVALEAVPAPMRRKMDEWQPLQPAE